MPELLIDFVTSLDGYAAADGWRAGGDWKDPRTPFPVGAAGWPTSQDN